jgi:hypothetical protein
MQVMSDDLNLSYTGGISREILAYLVRHPAARDTLEGIVLWWLLEGKINTTKNHVEAALKNLEANSFVCRSRKAGTSTEHFYINKEKLKQIIELLNSATAANGGERQHEN